MGFLVFGRYPWAPGRLSYPPGPILGSVVMWLCLFAGDVPTPANLTHMLLTIAFLVLLVVCFPACLLFFFVLLVVSLPSFIIVCPLLCQAFGTHKVQPGLLATVLHLAKGPSTECRTERLVS